MIPKGNSLDSSGPPAPRHPWVVTPSPRPRWVRLWRYWWRRRALAWYRRWSKQGLDQTLRSRKRVQVLFYATLLMVGVGLALWWDAWRVSLKTQFFSNTLPNPTAETLAQSSASNLPPDMDPLRQYGQFVNPEASPRGHSSAAGVAPSGPTSPATPSPVAPSPAPTTTPAKPTPAPSPGVTSPPAATQSEGASNRAAVASSRPYPSEHPPYEVAWADPSNYGDRLLKDINGQPLTQAPLIVLHETVYSADSAINYFQTPHTNEDDQASYHTLIRLDGTIVYLVPPEKRAFGAGNSVFEGPNGPEAVKTHAQYAPSVNNFSYHISLETPIDGENQNPYHSGYTIAQYESLAWLVAQSNVPDDRITTHAKIDRSESRMDPRSFDFQKFYTVLHRYRPPLTSTPAP